MNLGSDHLQLNKRRLHGAVLNLSAYPPVNFNMHLLILPVSLQGQSPWMTGAWMIYHKMGNTCKCLQIKDENNRQFLTGFQPSVFKGNKLAQQTTTDLVFTCYWCSGVHSHQTPEWLCLIVLRTIGELSINNRFIPTYVLINIEIYASILQAPM